MADNTPRLGLNTYGQGEDGWSHNDAAKAVDELAIERGPIADRPASGDYDDELYHATDQRILWRWDADVADWEAVGGAGSSGQPVPGTSYYDVIDATDVAAGSVDTDSATVTNGVTAGSVSAGQENITDTSVRLIADGEVISSFLVADYADIFATVQAAHDRLVSAGLDSAKIKLPPGDFGASTQLLIEKDVSIVGEGTTDFYAGTGGTRVRWTGAGEYAIVARGTSNSHRESGFDIINALLFKDFTLSNDGGSAGCGGVYLDGTTETNADGSIVRGVEFRNTHVQGFDAPAIHGEGTVFDIEFRNAKAKGSSANDTVLIENSANASSGPPSKANIYGGKFTGSNDGSGTLYHAINCRTNTFGFYGGEINQNTAGGSHGIRIAGGSGGVWGTHIEGKEQDTGSVGIRCDGSANGPLAVNPSSLHSWGYGMEVTGSRYRNIKVSFSPGSNSNSQADLHVDSSTDVRGMTILNPDLSVSGRRSGDMYQLPLGEETTTFDVAVDSTGIKTGTLFFDSTATFNRIEFGVASATQSDWQAGQPYVTETNGSSGIDWYVPVTSASATSGATATFTARVIR